MSPTSMFYVKIPLSLFWLTTVSCPTSMSTRTSSKGTFMIDIEDSGGG